MKRVLLGVLLCLGCQGGGGGSDAGLPFGVVAGGSSGAPNVANPDAPIDEDAIAQYTRDWCSFYERCALPVYADQQDCIDSLSCTLRDFIADSSITRGALLRCSGSISSSACTQNQPSDACFELVDELSIELGFEPGCGGVRCDEGSYCEDRDGVCPRCVRRAALGEPCDGVRCANGAYCNTSTWVCERLIAEGMPCASHGSCASGGPGALTLYCRDGVCRKPAAIGEPYAERLDCGVYARCVDGTCSDLARTGEACADSSECRTFKPCIQGTCVEACGLQRVGEPCGYDGQCIDAYCDEVSSMCIATRAEGATCGRSEECAEGLYCDGTRAMCAPRAAGGAACQLDAQCMSGHCVDQICQEPSCEP